MMDVSIVFQPSVGKLAVLYLAKRATPGVLTGTGSILGDAVDPTMFPAV